MAHPSDYQTAELATLRAIEAHLNVARQLNLYPRRFGQPLSLQLELTKRCNLVCDFCYNRSGPTADTSGDFSAAEWVRLAEEFAAEIDPFQVILSGGEPLLLRSHLKDIMRPFHERGAAFVLISNGWFLNDDVIEWLRHFRFFWIQISIDSTDPAIHDRKRGREGSWLRAVEAAKRVASAGLPLEVSGTFGPSEVETAGEYVDFCWDLGAAKALAGLVMPAGRAIDNEGRYQASDDLKREFDERLAVKRDQYRGHMEVGATMSLPLQLNRYSVLPASGCIVRPDGEVRLDCMAPFVSGNIRKRPFTEIWREVGSSAWSREPVRRYVNQISETWHGAEVVPRNYCEFDELVEEADYSEEPLQMLKSAVGDVDFDGPMDADIGRWYASTMSKAVHLAEPAVPEVGVSSLLKSSVRKRRSEGGTLVAVDAPTLQFHFLNGAGAKLLEAADDGLLVSDWLETLERRYPEVGREILLKDTILCTRDCVRRGLLTLDGASH